MRERIALIGHSGAGKSSCLAELAIVHKRADMDATFRTDRCPSLTDGIQWLVEDSKDQPIVAVSNHEKMLEAMRSAKKRGEHAEFFKSLRFVYLRQPKDRLAMHLAMLGPGGSSRPLRDQNYTLQNYERLHLMYQELADLTIDCTAKGVSEVAVEIRGLLGLQGLKA
jgi:shikimate kinase